MRRSLTMVVGVFLALGALVAPAAAAPFPARIELPDGWAPEGITAGAGATVFVGSLAGGAIWKGDVRTGVGAVLVDPVPGAVAVGVEYDRLHDRLWVAGGPTGEVRVYDAAAGELLR